MPPGHPAVLLLTLASKFPRCDQNMKTKSSPICGSITASNRRTEAWQQRCFTTGQCLVCHSPSAQRSKPGPAGKLAKPKSKNFILSQNPRGRGVPKKINSFLLSWSQSDKGRWRMLSSTDRGDLTQSRHKSSAAEPGAQVKAVSLTEEHNGRSCFSFAGLV